MTKKLNQALGYYDSSFFRMHLATKEKIERIDALSEKAYAIFVHEYIHFVQDITTIHGLNNIFSNIQYIKYANNEVYKTNGKFNVPILPDGVNVADFVWFNTLIADISNGNTDSYDNVEIINYRPIITPVDDRCVIKEMKIIELDIRIDDEYNDTYKFGAGCIYESMAYIMEKNMSQFGSVESPDMPYNSAIKLAEKIYKEFSEDELNVLAVCDISLNCSNPGKVFVEIINSWKSKGIIPEDPRELYDNFYKQQFQITKADKNKVTVENVGYLTYLEAELKLVENELYSYFRPKDNYSMDEFSENMRLINSWISEIFSSVLKFRTKNPYFIIDIAEGGERFNNTAFLNFYNEFGLPFCTNNNDGCYYHPKFKTSNLQLSYFSAASQINDIFNGSFNKCDFYGYCKKCKKEGTSDVVTDKRCSSPWDRCFDDRLCPVATIWKHWKLANHNPVWSD